MMLRLFGSLPTLGQQLVDLYELAANAVKAVPPVDTRPECSGWAADPTTCNTLKGTYAFIQNALVKLSEDVLLFDERHPDAVRHVEKMFSVAAAIASAAQDLGAAGYPKTAWDDLKAGITKALADVTAEPAQAIADKIEKAAREGVRGGGREATSNIPVLVMLGIVAAATITGAATNIWKALKGGR